MMNDLSSDQLHISLDLLFATQIDAKSSSQKELQQWRF